MKHLEMSEMSEKDKTEIFSEFLFEHKEHLSNGTYLEMMNYLKEHHNKKDKQKEDEQQRQLNSLFFQRTNLQIQIDRLDRILITSRVPHYNMKIGMYKGKCLGDVYRIDRNYFNWYLRTINKSEGVSLYFSNLEKMKKLKDELNEIDNKIIDITE